MEYISSLRSGKILVYENFMYTKEKEQGDKIHWRCRNRTSCLACLHVAAGAVIHRTEHNHLPSSAAVSEAKASVNMKKRAADTLESPRQIYQKVTNGMPLQAVAKLPTYRACQRTIERTRKSLAIPLPRPNSLQEIVTADQAFSLTHRGKEFVFLDTGSDDPKRIIVFATKAHILRLVECSDWLGDGTFKVSPSLFTQIYTIHGFVSGSVIPLVYACLPNKETDTYTRLFDALREEMCSVKESYKGPKRMIVDFELAAINAFKRVFSDTTMQGCNFHLGQSVFRKIQECHLSAVYGNDLVFTEQCKMMLALAFVPVDGVLGAWEALQDMPGRAFEVDSPLNQYFLEFYIGQLGTSRSSKRKRPIFPVELWNCHERAIAGVPRTTNSAEAWHLAFQRTFGSHHPSVYAFFEKLQHEQNHQENALEKLDTGNPPPPKKRKYEKRNAQLLAILGSYGKVPILEFLKRVSHVIEIDV